MLILQRGEKKNKLVQRFAFPQVQYNLNLNPFQTQSFVFIICEQRAVVPLTGGHVIRFSRSLQNRQGGSGDR